MHWQKAKSRLKIQYIACIDSEYTLYGVYWRLSFKAIKVGQVGFWRQAQGLA